MLTRFAYVALDTIGLPRLLRWRSRALVLCYHNVVADTSEDELGLHIPLERFREQVDWVRRHYDVVPLPDLLERLNAVRSSRRPLAAITFDDGYTGTLAHAWPLLRSLSLPATVFVVAGAPSSPVAAASGRPVGFWWDQPAVLNADPARQSRWLTELHGDSTAILQDLGVTTPVLPSPDRRPAPWEALLAAARDGLHLAAHSMTHRALPTLTDAELATEIGGCRDTIHQRTGIAPDWFAYPYGRWDARTQHAVRAAGFRGAVTLDIGLNRPGVDPWALRRVNIPAGIGAAAFHAWASGLYLRRWFAA